MATHFFTSAAVNYLPKARVLASSIRRHHPDGVIHLVLCDRLPLWFRLGDEPFDVLWTLDNLSLPAEPGWLFSHNIVELSTAVKGFALIKLLSLSGCDSVVYFDPDIVVLASLEQLLSEFQSGSILLTPHSTEPDSDRKVIEDNEIVSLRHGTFNLGFLGVKNDSEGRRFAEWWRDRLRDFCFDDVPFGLFTDQRWADLIPSFFPNHRILTDPAYNVCTWNLNSRVVTGGLKAGLLVNGKPLVFYHFSGLDRGAQKIMLQRYGRHMPPLFDLRAWYKAACEGAGQSLLGASEWSLNRFEDGKPILQSHRDLYRRDSRVRQWFSDPYQTAGPAPSFIDWYKRNGEVFTFPYVSAQQRVFSPSYQYRVVVVTESGALPDLETLAQLTSQRDDILVVNDSELDWARVLSESDDRDLAVLHAGVQPPWLWDKRLAWSAERNPDALSISPIVARANFRISPDDMDRLAYWTRWPYDPEIAVPFTACCYFRSKPLRQVIGSDAPVGLAPFQRRIAPGGWRHRLATHLCVSSDLPAPVGVCPDFFADEVRTHRLPDGALPSLSAVASAPTLHIVNESGIDSLTQFCCSRKGRDHFALIAHGHGQQHGTSFRLSRYLGGKFQKLESWAAGVPIRTVALSHSVYHAAIREALAKFRPAQIIVWSLLGHSLDCFRSDLPTVAFAQSLSVPGLLRELDSSFIADAVTRELCRTLQSNHVTVVGRSQSELNELRKVAPECRVYVEDAPLALTAAEPEASRYFSGPQAPPLEPGYALQLYWDSGAGYSEGASATVLARGGARQRIRLRLLPTPMPLKSLRLDLGREPLLVDLFEIHIFDGLENSLWKWTPASPSTLATSIESGHQLVLLNANGTSLRIGCTGSDPYFVLPLDAPVLARIPPSAFLEADVSFDSRPDTLQQLLLEVNARARFLQAENAHSTHILNQRVAVSDASAAQSQAQASRLEAQCAALDDALRSVTSSASWRLTAPLRVVKQLLGAGEKTRP